MTFWCERAWVADAVAERVLVTCEDGVITAVTPGAEPAGAHRLTGVVFPGFANAHSHAFHRALRGRTHADGGTFWTWREAMYSLAARLDPDSYHALARLVYAEMVAAGFTCVGEFHYLHHAPGGARYADPNAMGDALLRAAADAGIRITLLDTCYLAGGLDGSGYQPLTGTQLRFGDGDVDSWATRVAGLRAAPHARIGAAVHSVRAVPATALPGFADATCGVPVHVHLSEQTAENLACQAFHGVSPTALLASAGILGPDTTAVHATHLSDEDIRTLGSTACFCPTTEADLADGIGPAHELAGAGCPIALGTDQHAVVDPFLEAQALERGERLRTGLRGRFTPAQLIASATVAGHRSLGWPSAGRIALGAPADLVAVSLDSVRTAGSAPEQVILTATASDVDTVVVGGRVTVSGGEHAIAGSVGPELARLIRELTA
ncbi:MAG TPA: formimidoylglutamate deiminase [Pseudonocardiaceae bacterium]|nr:formimidoylglutamate deiminase [Pseudonocardiaceae bacterium]